MATLSLIPINKPNLYPRQFAAPTVGYILGEASGADKNHREVEGPKVNDLHVQASTYGKPIPIIYGTFRLAGNLIWATDMVYGLTRKWTDYKTKTVFPSVPTYLCSFAVAICEGPIAGIRKIWADGKLYYDNSVENKSPIRSLFRCKKMKIYKGTEDQLPDPTIEADKGLGMVPGHRGMVYVVFKDLELLKFGNRIPNLTFEVVQKGKDTFIGSNYLGPGRWARIDPETGYVWAGINISAGSAPNTGNDLLDPTIQPGSYLYIYDPDTMLKLRTLNLPYEDGVWLLGENMIPAPFFPIFAASFEAMNYSPITKTMVVSSGQPLASMGWVVSTETFRTEIIRSQTSPFYWPGVAFYNEIPPSTGVMWLSSVNGLNQGSVAIHTALPGAYYDEAASLSDAVGTNPGGPQMWVENECHSPDFAHQALWGYSTRIRIDNVNYDVGDILIANGDYFYVFVFQSVMGCWDEVGQQFLFAINNTIYRFSIERKIFERCYVITGEEDIGTGAICGILASPDTGNIYIQPETLVGIMGPAKVAVLNTAAEGMLEYSGTTYPGGPWQYADATFDPRRYYIPSGSGKIIGSNGAGVFVGGSATTTEYIGNETWMVNNGGLIWLVHFAGPIIPEQIFLWEIIRDISLRDKLPETRFDVTQLIDAVDGFALLTNDTGRASVEALEPVYFFDSVESDGKIKFVKRGQPSRMAISSADTLLPPR